MFLGSAWMTWFAWGVAAAAPLPPADAPVAALLPAVQQLGQAAPAPATEAETTAQVDALVLLLDREEPELRAAAVAALQTLTGIPEDDPVRWKAIFAGC